MHCFMWEIKIFSLFSFTFVEVELNLSLMVFIFRVRPIRFSSAISLEICKHCFVILSSGKFCKFNN